MSSSTKHLIALIDIMGFSSFVHNSTSVVIHKQLSTFVDNVHKLNEHGFEYNITVFSDTAVIIVPVEEKTENEISAEIWKFFLLINNIQLLNICEGGLLPLRGGITLGDFFTDGNELLFGKGLIEVHEAECKLACYPRIIVNQELIPPNVTKTASNNLHSFFSDSGFYGSTRLKPILFDERKHPVRIDFDGLNHCNYLSSLCTLNGWVKNDHDILEKHKNYIVSNLSKSSKNKILFAKYHWMKTYHNWFCTGYDNFSDHLIN